MGLGFEVTNDAGSKQVIDTVPVVTFKDKFTVVSGNTTNGYLGFDDIFALKPANGGTLLNNTFVKIYDNQKERHKIVGQGEVIRFNDGAAPLGGERYGLEVYNEQGALQFTSNQRPLKILDVFYSTDIRNTETTVNGIRTYWSKNYGVLDVAALIVTSANWGEDPHFMKAAPARRGGVFSFEAAVEHTDGFIFDYAGNPENNWGMHALILDVTNY